jgi:hypothetical protein
VAREKGPRRFALTAWTVCPCLIRGGCSPAPPPIVRKGDEGGVVGRCAKCHDREDAFERHSRELVGGVSSAPALGRGCAHRLARAGVVAGMPDGARERGSVCMPLLRPSRRRQRRPNPLLREAGAGRGATAGVHSGRSGVAGAGGASDVAARARATETSIAEPRAADRRQHGSADLAVVSLAPSLIQLLEMPC